MCNVDKCIISNNNVRKEDIPNKVDCIIQIHKSILLIIFIVLLFDIKKDIIKDDNLPNAVVNDTFSLNPMGNVSNHFKFFNNKLVCVYIHMY